MSNTSERRESILSVLRGKGPSYIKDISLVVRNVSEKTIQRELAALVSEGLVVRKGDRRWTTYELA
jgi:DeoR/GlpR family transcriptional regulator of sugar metabolism